MGERAGRGNRTPAPTGREEAAPTLARRERIRRRRDFLRIQRRGTRTRGRYMTLVGRPGDRACSRLGVVVPRRLGNAVRRNLIKRRVRELFRHDKPAAVVDLVVLPFREFPDAAFSAVQRDYRRTLLRQLRALGVAARAG